MFPLSHIYVSTKVTGKESDLLVLGSVIPDLDWTSQGRLKSRFHDSPFEFSAFTKENFFDLSDLALGVELHSSASKGLDFYSDNLQTGYAKVLGRRLVEDALLILGTEDKEKTLTFVHGFIEAAVDLRLQNDFPKLIPIYKKAFRKENLLTTAKCLSAYLNTDKKIVLKELNYFFNFLSPEVLSSKEKTNKKIFIPLAGHDFNRRIQAEQFLPIFRKAGDLVKDSYAEFLNQTINKMKLDLKSDKIVAKLIGGK